MSSVEYLREFVNERLTAAAEEIFRVFNKTIVQYEEEIDRQRRLLDIVWKPEVKLHRIELPQQHVCTEEEVLADQQLCIQERNSSLDQEDPEPPQIKEEQEQLCTSQEGEQLVLKQETDTFMLTPTYEESDHSEDQTLYFNPDENLSAAETESVVNTPVKSSVVSEPNRDQQLVSHNSHVAESQDHKRGNRRKARSAESARCTRTTRSTKSSCFKCSSCSKVYYSMATLNAHKKTHSDEKPFKCDTCVKVFRHYTSLKRHTKTHTEKLPYACRFCGRHFRFKLNRDQHIKSHADDKLYLCGTCGQSFRKGADFKTHMKIHRGELHTCEFCGKKFTHTSYLIKHLRVHTVERPYECLYCGRNFPIRSDLTLHAEFCSLRKNATVLDNNSGI